jgi:hypothetical protein
MTNEDKEGLTQEDRKEAIRHLLLAFPDVEVEHDGQEVVDSLVEGALAELVAEKGVDALLTADDVVEIIRHLTTLEYSKLEVIASFERLHAKGWLELRDPGHRSCKYSPRRYAEVRADLATRARRTERVLQSWREDMTSRHGLSTEQARLLEDQLDHLI